MSSGVEHTFIDFLSFKARLGNFVWPNNAMHSLMDAKDKICNEFKQDLSFHYCLTKLDLLEQRFLTFKWMLTFDGLIYDRNANVVTAPDPGWNSILEVNIMLNSSSLMFATFFHINIKCSLLVAKHICTCVSHEGRGKVQRVVHYLCTFTN